MVAGIMPNLPWLDSPRRIRHKWIMDISGVSRTQSTQTAGKTVGPRKAGGDKDFKSLLDVDDAENAEPAGGIGGVSAVDALLFAQETGDAMEGRQKNRQRAKQMLDKLDELKMDLLTGTVTVAKLQYLSSLVVQERTPMDDPELSGILDEIELRVAVELAKREV